MKHAKHSGKHADAKGTQAGRLTTKEDIIELNSIDQIAMIEDLAEKITSNPSENTRSIQTLLHLIEYGGVTVSHLAILTTAEVFKDIVPLYATDLQETEKRLQNIITKEERFMLNQELMLVELYEKYNRLLFSLKQNLEELVQKEEESEKRKKLRQSLEKYDLVMCKALSELGKELYHYNYAREIVKYVLRFALHKKEDVRQIVTDFVSFFLSSQNPSTYTFKLLILEHFEKLFKQKKFVSMMPESVFAALTHTYTEDSSVQAKQDKSDDSLDKRIQDLRDRKRKNKLSKSGDKQLKQLEFQRSRRNERRKKQGLDDPRLQKELKNELAQSEAVIDPAKINKLVVYSDPEQPDHPEVLLHHVQGREGVPRQQALHDGG